METNCYAFSIQLGTFRSPEGEYFVEPLHSYQGEHYEEEHTKPHVVYRKSAPKKQHTSEENSACDTSGMMYYMTCTHAYNLHRQIYPHIKTIQTHKGATSAHACKTCTTTVCAISVDSDLITEVLWPVPNTPTKQPLSCLPVYCCLWVFPPRSYVKKTVCVWFVQVHVSACKCFHDILVDCA